jgi:hypothetical protein
MRDWGVNANGYKIITLDSGLGDHYAFLQVLPAIIKRYPNLILSVCYPDVFRDYPSVKIISIAEAFAGNHRDGVYGYMINNGWTHEKGTLIDAYKEAYCN